VARVASKQAGLAGELNGARATLADLKREQDGLVAEGSSLRNNVTKMANKVTSVTAEHYNIVRELSSKQDHLNNKILLLWNNATELADELARVAGRPGWRA
jgi:hypothetical protein